jgi:hypothetical protein
MVQTNESFKQFTTASRNLNLFLEIIKPICDGFHLMWRWNEQQYLSSFKSLVSLTSLRPKHAFFPRLVIKTINPTQHKRSLVTIQKVNTKHNHQANKWPYIQTCQLQVSWHYTDSSSRNSNLRENEDRKGILSAVFCDKKLGQKGCIIHTLIKI